eukprot:jgi/Chrzof1/1670/Cz10g16180.t1
MMDNPASKAKRYDRQIRIWGSEGQQRLENCRVALLNSSATGAETLKNLVLGGIASFTIVDGNKVTARDLGNNFLVDAEHMGTSRAQVVTELLKDMNESVSGSYVEDTPENLIDRNPKFFEGFDLVLATQASLSEHQVIESKPDTQVDDLRITCPWPELRQYATSFDLEQLDDNIHKHVPYGVILIQAAHHWHSSHGDQLPANSKDRSAVKDTINRMRRRTEDVPLDEENFDEALKAAFHVWTPPAIPSEVRRLFDDEKCTPSPSSDEFWVLLAALKAFVEHEGEGRLPVEGSIPDMHATTDLYLRLQRIYHDQAVKGAAAVEAHVRQILAGLGRSTDGISHEAVRHLSKNARNIRVLRYRPLAEEVSGDVSSSSIGSTLAAKLGGEEAANAALYILLRAVDRFYRTHGRHPGCYDSEVEDDVPLLKAAAQQILGELGVSGVSVQDDYVAEMCRFGASELHVVSAVMGGMAAQEAIKLITQQFVPFTGTLVYNGMASTTSVFEL